MKIHAAAQTHVGNVRANNEDNFYLCGNIRGDVTQKAAACQCTARDSQFLAAVADGMGGEDFGELASLLAVKSLYPCKYNEAYDTALTCIRRANAQICAESGRGSRMGSTLVALYIDGGKALCCNVGDSRCYLLRKGVLTRLSTDHSKAERMIQMGILTPEQAANHRSRHMLTQHLGISEEEMILEPAFCQVSRLRPGDVFLLCSDGLTDMVPESELIDCLISSGTPEDQTMDLLDLALTHGGKDNVTALVVHIQESLFPLNVEIPFSFLGMRK